VRKFLALIDQASVFVGRACGVFYVLAILLSVYEVFSRYVLDEPTTWTTEIIMALCGSAWLLSVGAVTQQNRHITVTVLEVVLSKKTWHYFQIVAVALSILAVLGLMWASWEAFTNSFSRIERSGSAFNPPLPSYLKILIEFALALYILQLFSRLHRLWDSRDQYKQVES